MTTFPFNTGSSLFEQRRYMLGKIADDAAETAVNTGRSAFSSQVMAAMGKVERHLFVPEEQADYAYENRPLPIGHGQTISQPYIVALMIDLLDLHKDGRVLEIGTGSGYQAALLAELAGQVYSVEIVEALYSRTRRRLHELGYANIALKLGDGWDGWAEHAPYDAIIVSAAPEDIPPALIQQLKPGGKIVIPLGPAYATQQLVLGEKRTDGSLHTRRLLPVLFVPFTSRDE